MRLFYKLLWTLIMTGSLLAQSADEAVDLLDNQDGFGVRAAALGNAYVGVADDYSALYWNPAGLAQIGNTEVNIGLSHFKTKADINYLGNAKADSRAFTRLSHFGMVYPFAVARGSLVMAMGYHRLKNLDSYLNFSGNLRGTKGDSLAFDVINEYAYDYGLLEFDRDVAQQQTLSSEGSLSQWSFGMAIDVSPRFSAGFTLNLLSGSNNYLSRYKQDNLVNDLVYTREDDQGNTVEELWFKYYDVTQKVESEYAGLEAKLGGMFRLTDNLQLGGTVTLPTSIRVTENWSSEDDLAYEIYDIANDETYLYNGMTEDPYENSSYLGWVLNSHDQAVDMNASGTFDYDITVPFRFGTGLSFQNRLFLLAASAEYTDWSQLRYEKPDNRDSEDYTALFSQNDVFAENYTDVLSWSVGGELKLFDEALALRGGYRSVPSALKKSLGGFDRQYYTAGLGMKLDETTFLETSYVYGSYKTDGAYGYAWDEYNEITPMQTSEEHTTQKFLVGLKLVF